MTEEMYKECNYRFKGNSCKECPLGCIGKIDELQRLKQQHNDDTEEIAKLGLDVAILEQENAELRKIYNENLNQEYDKRQALKKENAELKALNEKICEDCSKEIKYYWKALEEIREIAKDTFHCCDDDCGNARKIKLIIDKINECIGG